MKYKEIEKYLIKFLQNEVYKTGLKKAVVGLSGGIDSAVVAVLSKKAFDDGLLCILMPSQYSSKSSVDDAKELCEKFDINYEIHSIEPMLKAYENSHKKLDKLRVGNFSARLRMATLFDISSREGALVIGTSNKSELMLGYGTIYGDLASAVNPIGDMYKSEIFEFARYLGVTQNIINKPPSADLWQGQSDEADLGYSYDEIDRCLKLYVEERLDDKKIVEKRIDKNLLEMVKKRIYQNHFKRKMPVIAKLTGRTLNHDFNYPRDITL